MISLIIAIIFGLGLTFFAFSNSISVPVAFAGFQFSAIPLYLVVVFAVLAGIVMAWFISAIDGISSHMEMRGKNNRINDDQKAITALQDRIHNLEVENAKLKTDNRGVMSESKEEHADNYNERYKPSFWERLFPKSNRHYTKHF
jgi:uncharacterized integral membrane protein